MKIKNTNKIITQALDFDTIKANLKTFLSSQDTLKDYDFEGSALSVIIDLLSYNTHYNALYNNMALNESFLDSASKRNSVVSIAKMLNYRPRSATCARSTFDVSLDFNNTEVIPAENRYIINRLSEFTSTLDNNTYTFTTRGDHILNRSLNDPLIFNAFNIEVIEGKHEILSIEVENNKKYIIPQRNVDLSTLIVSIRSENVLSSINYKRADTISQFKSGDNIYFIKELDDGLYEVMFSDGNNVFGEEPANGNVVILDYFISSLELPNGANQFTFNDKLPIPLTYNSIQPASGGASPESLQSIKEAAPRYFTSQNRAVTVDDYRTLILNQFSNISSISVWGGENNTPPQFGKIFISIHPTNGDKLSTNEKTSVTNYIRDKNIVSIIPELIDPTIIDINITAYAYIDSNLLYKDINTLENEITYSIEQYNNTINKFDSVFRYSQLLNIIDEVDVSITNSNLSFVLSGTINANLNTESIYNININNPIQSNTEGFNFVTTGFFINGDTRLHYLTDDGQGIIYIYYIDGNHNINAGNVGNINYIDGRITINNLNISSIGDEFRYTIKPAARDIVSINNNIVNIKNISIKTILNDIENYQHFISND